MFTPYKSEFNPQNKLDINFDRHISYYVGAAGAGKTSRMIDELLNTVVAAADVESMPNITFVHNAVPDSRFIDVIEKKLKPQNAHLVVSKNLINNESCAINPFDIKVGQTRPVKDEVARIAAFLTTLFTPLEMSAPYPSIAPLVQSLIKKLFDSNSYSSQINGHHKMYVRGRNSVVDGTVDKYEVVSSELYSEITASQLTRLLHLEGGEHPQGSEQRTELWKARDLVHRTAMPVMVDVIDILDDMLITYPASMIDTGETVVEFARRIAIDAVAQYPCFSLFTQFDVSDARIVAINLEHVLVDGNHRNNSLFLQIAAMVCTSNLPMLECDAYSNCIDEDFVGYYAHHFIDKNHLKKNHRTLLAIDDMDCVAGEHSIVGLFSSIFRESRKHSLEIMFSSSSLSDFQASPVNASYRLLELVTFLYVLSNPDTTDIEVLKKYFTANNVVLNGLSSTGVIDNKRTYFSYVVTKRRVHQWFSTVLLSDDRFASLTT